METVKEEKDVPSKNQAAVKGEENSDNEIGETNSSPMENKEKHGVKRPADEASEGVKKYKKRRTKLPGPVLPKNAVCQLNELRPGLVYNLISQVGPVHAPVFTVSVEVNGQQFLGNGRSKKQAKQSAAEAALKSFVQFPNASEAHVAMGRRIMDMDFTSDNAEQDVVLGNSFESNQKPLNRSNGNENSSPNQHSLNGSENSYLKPNNLPPLPPEKNPVMLLNELRTGLQFVLQAETGEAHAKRFTMSVTVDGQTFEGQGPSKRLAKTAAAKAALVTIFNMNFNPLPAPYLNYGQGDRTIGLPQILADHVARLIIGKFTMLMEGQANHARRKVLAGIVMTTSNRMEDAIVIAVATGTKCINGEHMSVKGASLNDCHAEIIARRCLLDFLYSQLEFHTKPDMKDKSILVEKRNGGFTLRENVKFHLYINTAPCGDARIFSPHESTSPEMEDKHPNRKARGLLRTKIESGEGTIPVKYANGIQTWDGVLQGQRLLTMSCSDKICRWNVLGLQGSLLSYFIEPIYLDSIILGSLFHPTHLFRAVCGRISGTIQGLPPPYRLNTPLMSLISSPEVRQPGKAPNFSVNWTIGRPAPEIVNATTGKTEQGQPSHLAKQALFQRFLNLYNKLSKNLQINNDMNINQYADAKAAVTDYQIAKEQLLKAFQRAELGVWMEKPIEQDQFYLDD